MSKKKKKEKGKKKKKKKKREKPQPPPFLKCISYNSYSSNYGEYRKSELIKHNNKMEHVDGIVVGIDFGTTNSCWFSFLQY